MRLSWYSPGPWRSGNVRPLPIAMAFIFREKKKSQQMKPTVMEDSASGLVRFTLGDVWAGICTPRQSMRLWNVWKVCPRVDMSLQDWCPGVTRLEEEGNSSSVLSEVPQSLNGSSHLRGSRVGAQQTWQPTGIWWYTQQAQRQLVPILTITCFYIKWRDVCYSHPQKWRRFKNQVEESLILSMWIP